MSNTEILRITLAQMEALYLKNNKSYLSSQNRWKDNEVDKYFDSNITKYYQNNIYGRKTRWEVWQKAVSILKKNNISMVIDIGCANGHFPFLCLSSQIECYGIDPRSYKDAEDLFNQIYGDKHIYQSSMHYFTEFMKNNTPSRGVSIECVTILNFLHGKGHKKDEIIELFDFVSLHSKSLVSQRYRPNNHLTA